MRPVLFFGYLILVGAFVTFYPSLVFAEDVEVLVNGKTYPSMREYKKAQLKAHLSELLSYSSLKDFSDEELLEIIRGVRLIKSSHPNSLDKSSNNTATQAISKDEPDAQDDQNQMKEMLSDYMREHKGVKPVPLDQQKIKSIIIQDTAAH